MDSRENIRATDFTPAVSRTAQTAQDHRVGGRAAADAHRRTTGDRNLSARRYAHPIDRVRDVHARVVGTLDPYTPVTATGESWMQFRSRIGLFEDLVPAARRNRMGSPPEEPSDPAAYLLVAYAGVIEAVFEYIFEKGRGVSSRSRPTTQGSRDRAPTAAEPSRLVAALPQPSRTTLTDEMRT